MRAPFIKMFLLFSLLVTVISSTAYAAPHAVLTLGDKPSYHLTGYLEIYKDPTTRLTVQQAAGLNNWSQTVPGKTPNLGMTRSVVWLRFFIDNPNDPARNFYVSFEYPVTNSVTCYVQDAQGKFQEMRTGSTTPASANVVPDRHFLFPLNIGSGQSAAVYLRIQSTSGMTLPVRILSDQGLTRKAIRDYTVYGALFGLLLLVLLYFMTMSSFLHKDTRLWLCLYSIFFGLHTIVRGGFLRLIIPDAVIPLISILQLLFIGGLFFTGAKFFRLFLNLKDHSPILDRIMWVFQYLSLVFVVFALFPNPVVTPVSLILFVVNPLFSIILAFYFWRKGVGNAGYFAVGWLVAHFVSGYDFFRINGVLPYPPLGEWLIPCSFLIAFLFLSIALIRQNAADHLMAETDPLTKLANRRKFDESLNDEWSRCRRLKTPLSLIMADVDNFKKFNDSFGHNAGDQCLRRIADILGQHARRTGDLAARYGGEEFVLLLPNTDAASTFAIAEKIRTTIGNDAPDGSNLRYIGRITISMGVAAIVPSEEKNPEDLVVAADKALYEAKHAGRNRTVASTAEAV